MTVTVVTGCSTGIGYATALRLAADGHTVVATMRDPDACDLGVVAKERGLDVELRALDVNSTPGRSQSPINELLEAFPVR